MLKGKNSEIEDRFVETGISNDKSIEIISGLNEADTVLIETARPKRKKVEGFRIPGFGGGKKKFE